MDRKDPTRKLLVGSLAARPSIPRLSINDNMKIPEVVRRIDRDGRFSTVSNKMFISEFDLSIIHV